MQIDVPLSGSTIEDPNECYERESVSSLNTCAIRAARAQLSATNNRAINIPAFYYNEAEKTCLLLQFFDTTLSLEGRKGWVKYAVEFEQGMIVGSGWEVFQQ